MNNKQNKLFKKEYIPNYLTIIRILIVPIIIPILLINFGPIIYSFSFQNTNIDIKLNLLIGAILFIVASITDAADGYLARKYKWISNFGKFWDPLADKILTNSTLFCLAAPNLNLIPIWIPIIMLIRDIIIDGTRMVASNQNIVIAANIYGKLKTVNTMIAIILVMFIGVSYTVDSGIYYWLIQNFLMYTSLALSLISGIIYVIRYYKQIQEIKHG